MEWRLAYLSTSLFLEGTLCFLLVFQILLRFYYARTEDHLFHKFGPLYVVYQWCGFIGISVSMIRTMAAIFYPSLSNCSFLLSDIVSLTILLACFYTIFTVCAVVNHHLTVFNPLNGPQPQRMTPFLVIVWLLLCFGSAILDILILCSYLPPWWKGIISVSYVLTCFSVIGLLHNVDLSLGEVFRVITPDPFGFRGIQNEKSSLFAPNPPLIQGAKDQNYKRWKVLKGIGQLLAGFAGLLRLIEAGYALGSEERKQDDRFWLSASLILFQQIGLFLLCWYAWISPRSLIVFCWPDSLLNLRTINDTSETLMVYSSLHSESRMISVDSARSGGKKITSFSYGHEYTLT